MTPDIVYVRRPNRDHRSDDSRKLRAFMRVRINRIVRKYDYPPDKQAKATDLVLQQAEVLCKDWVEKG